MAYVTNPDKDYKGYLKASVNANSMATGKNICFADLKHTETNRFASEFKGHDFDRVTIK